MYVSFNSSKETITHYKNLFTIPKYTSITLPYVILLNDGSNKIIYGMSHSILFKPIFGESAIIVKIEPTILALYYQSKRNIQQQLLNGEKIDLSILPDEIQNDITITKLRTNNRHIK